MVPVMITVPDSLASLLLRDNDDAQQWIDNFPRLSRDILRAWGCEADGEARAGAVAVVIPVASPLGPAMIKISYPHPGNVDEPKALELWNGDGAVRLLDSDPSHLALLLERVADRQLDTPPDEGIRIGGDLLARLAIPAPPGMKRLADTTAEWEQQVRDDHHRADRPLRRRTLDTAIETIRDLGHDTTTTMLHGDLHGGNILHSDRGWVAIDPKGMAGTAAYDALTMCSYRLSPTGAATDLVDETLRRIDIFCEAVGVDPDLTRRCVHARAVTALLWDFARDNSPRTGNFEYRMHITEGLLRASGC